MKEQILKDFEASKETLESFHLRIVSLIRDLLSQASIGAYQISGRTKDMESLSRKIDRKQEKYLKLDDITDIVGIRIITYLESQVDLIADLIEREFAIDKKNSIDKRVLKSDQFGYRSLHIVISIDDSRSGLTEYKKFKDLKCELQIRSVLQHAWAEIEHDLGYKGKYAIPDEHVRSFNRLAALLETADIEFDRLKKELVGYEKSVAKLIRDKPQEVEINQASIFSFVASNEVIKKANAIVAQITGAKIYEVHEFRGMLTRFEFFGIKTIKQLEDSMANDKVHYLSFIKAFLDDSKFESLPSSAALYYYQHFLAGKSGDRKFVTEYLNYETPVIDNSDDAAGRLINLCKK